MNLILLQSEGEASQLPDGDPRTHHIRTVLRTSVGGTFYVGLRNGPRGLATLLADEGASGLTLSTKWETRVPKPQPIELLVGLPRPQTARRILHDVASMGVRAIHFFQSDKGEPSYAESKLWQSDEWQRRLDEGAAQGFSTIIPQVTHATSLHKCIQNLDTSKWACLALDIYEATSSLGNAAAQAKAIATEDAPLLAIGSERGWSAAERDVLREYFTIVHLGQHVLRTEVAVIAGATLMLSAVGALDAPYVADV